MRDYTFSPQPRIKYGQLKRILSRYRYIALRTPNGELCAVNCRVASLHLSRSLDHPQADSPFVSYFAIDFHTYITHKAPLYI